MENHPLELRQETAGTFFETDQPETGLPAETGFTGLPKTTDTFTTAFTGTGTITGARSTGSPTTSSPTNGSPTTSTSTPTQTNSGGGRLGIGLGVPLGFIIIAGLVGLGWFLGRRSKKQAAAVANSQPEMVGPAELGGASQPVSSELPTKGNTHEMPTGAWMGQPQGQLAPAELGENR
ncbi:uncharacterized protein BDZ99DRAFT_468902 [Mytilinidion resinicola]|uniref:Mid2 domain-containing protein n=1 Tax=Mytilinidion resinicola TaxID=574789 RepID=A0A6A6Y0U0_9PEZI|nr:uncharacterized protein BDZ99DRAFT_468902 [Mytilinidion resinicola]KAF2802436.1 hypothetical protein BDZ99DRAFT_468902 [Mytilinidion resinicola]